MKIDKTNPKHWATLIFSGLMLLLVLLPARIIARFSKRKRVVLYGHKLNGNLLPFYEYGQEPKSIFDFYYLSLDREYIRKLDYRRNILSGVNPRHLFILAGSDALITDHSPHHFVILKYLTKMKFIDVWHGIPYKGFNDKSFKIKYYDEIWVSSEDMKDLWVNKFGFDPHKVKVTGYARVERLINLKGEAAKIRLKYGLENKKTILVAPTWQQDDNGRSIIPFGMNLGEFVECVSRVGDDVQVIFRAHLNVKDRHEINGLRSNVKIMSYADYPVGEDFLAISDVLISDWSSIVFDFLVLDRPVIYLDVKSPFKHGFSLGPEYRFGSVVSSGDALSNQVRLALRDPSSYQRTHRMTIERAKRVAYGNTLDGETVNRSIKRLDSILNR